MGSIRVIQYGLGPIGGEIARLVASRAGLELVGGVDVDPGKVGRDLGEVIGLPKPLRLPVCAQLNEVLAYTGADIVLHSTSSSLTVVRPQVEACIRAGLRVISTCEELAYPRARHPEVGEALHALALEHGVAVLGTGINPGYAMDALPLFISAACQQVRSIYIRRALDASTRRYPLQQKVGIGLSVAEFERLVEAQKVRHVGLIESATMLADGFGWELDKLEETIEPVIADRVLRNDGREVQPGQVAGVHQVARGFVAGHQVLTLDLCMALGVQEAGDFVRIRGIPDVELTMKGIHGDLGTAAVVVNVVPRVMEAAPGLLTMKDIALPSYWWSM